MERIFPSESPNVKKVEIKSRGHVRRARLYYLRELRGKKARLRSKLRDVSSLVSDEELEAAQGEAESGEEGVAVEEETAVEEASEPAEAPEAAESAESEATAEAEPEEAKAD